ncbi:Helix-turn-helix [Lachnospiraceae bacterium XBD2001]|nr:Helix-turn-helix [Lachnospiraceae bacterium XBD2001]
MGYPSIDMIATGARIENLMRANNLSARQVADFMGFKAPQAVYKWLRGDSLPTLDNMCALSVLLHTNMESILVLMGGDVFLCSHKKSLISYAPVGDDSQNPWLVKDKP